MKGSCVAAVFFITIIYRDALRCYNIKSLLYVQILYILITFILPAHDGFLSADGSIYQEIPIYYFLKEIQR